MHGCCMCSIHMQTMGLPVDRQQIEKLVSELDDDGSGEIEFGEFMAIMQKELYDSDPHASVWKDDIYTAEDRKRGKPRKHNQDTSSADPPKKAKKDNLMPLNLLAGAYRRKKVRETKASHGKFTCPSLHLHGPQLTLRVAPFCRCWMPSWGTLAICGNASLPQGMK